MGQNVEDNRFSFFIEIGINRDFCAFDIPLNQKFIQTHHFIRKNIVHEFHFLFNCQQSLIPIFLRMHRMDPNTGKTADRLDDKGFGKS